MINLKPEIRALLISDIRGAIEEVNDLDPVSGSDILGAFQGLEAVLLHLDLDGNPRRATHDVMLISHFAGRASALLDAKLTAHGKKASRWPVTDVARWKNVALDAYCFLMPRGD
jgi:hypothetical protein